ncbi:MAG: ATP-binding cassette domain-containing protein, partial [Cryomorphaceae bacterium]|nr:ATP-binding cassette domain-containing protein [Cryomorphaceae bacterium]
MNTFRGVNLRVQSGSKILLQGLDLDLNAGECLALVGESGSGKSLTALALMGLLPPGLEAVWQECSDNLSAKAMVFQEPMSALNPTMRVGRQVAEA